MSQFLPEIRNAARAFIVRDGSVLLLQKNGGDRGERYALPGGAQDPGETLLDALQRECMEEIGTEVQIGELLFVADFFKLRETAPLTRRHVVEFLFQCVVPVSYEARNGHRPDRHQVGVVWAPLEAVRDMPMSPPYLATALPGQSGRADSLYLGCFDDQPYT